MPGAPAAILEAIPRSYPASATRFALLDLAGRANVLAGARFGFIPIARRAADLDGVAARPARDRLLFAGDASCSRGVRVDVFVFAAGSGKRGHHVIERSVDAAAIDDLVEIVRPVGARGPLRGR